MNTESLALFVEVARLGSFAAVARLQDLDPSSVSRTIAVLESQLGIRLFQRTTRRLLLTEAGELYLNRIEPLLDEFLFAKEEAQRVSVEPAGKLRMTASVAFGQECILPHLGEFKRLYPNIKVELQLTDAVMDLVANGVDLACRLAAEVEPGLVGTRLFDVRYHVCMSSEYRALNPPIQQPDDLAQHDCVVLTLADYSSRWMFKKADQEQLVSTADIQSSLSISSALALKQAVLSGLGPSLLADWLVRDDIAEGKLVTVLDQYDASAQNFETAAWLLYPSRHFLPNKTRVMIDFLKEKLGPVNTNCFQ